MGAFTEVRWVQKHLRTPAGWRRVDVVVVSRILVSHDLWCIKANKTGEPAHPLYQPYAREPFIWIRSPLGLAS